MNLTATLRKELDLPINQANRLSILEEFRVSVTTNSTNKTLLGVDTGEVKPFDQIQGREDQLGIVFEITPDLDMNGDLYMHKPPLYKTVNGKRICIKKGTLKNEGFVPKSKRLER